MAGLCLRGRRRPARHAQIWHGRPARLFRRRPALARPLWVRRARPADVERGDFGMKITLDWLKDHLDKIGRASCRERVCQSVWISVVAVPFKKKKKIRSLTNNTTHNT